MSATASPLAVGVVAPPPPTSAPTSRQTASDASPRALTAQLNPSRSRRLAILLAFPLIFALAVPFWWYVTSIERLALPVERIKALETAPATTIRSTILLTSSSDAYPPPPAGIPPYSAKQVCEALGDAVLKSVDGVYRRAGDRGTRWWDMVYEVADKRHPPALHVHITQSAKTDPDFPLRPYVQTPHMGISLGGLKAGTLVIPVHPTQVANRYLREHLKLAITDAILGLYPSSPPPIPLRALKYSPNITLSFVLLNEDAAAGSYVRSWDIEGAIREHITPHLEPLRPIFNFSIESQIFYHAPLSFEPHYGPAPSPGQEGQRQLDAALTQAGQGDAGAEEVAKALIDEEKRDKAWIVDEEMMKVFVNSERWTLDSGISQNPVLRFLLFIPSEQHRPLLLSSPDNAQSFLLPQFGAVVLLNPPSSAPSSPSFHLPSAALTPPFHLFTQHLYSLLALPARPEKVYPCPPDDPRLPPSGTGLLEGVNRWQIEAVARQRMAENELEARKTLAGIVRLVAKIKEMKVGEGVRDKVLGVVERLELMANTKDPLQAFILSRDAVGLANQAFFDPSMMGLLYFPNEHKFAVYTPLFAPVALPILVGLLKELLGWVRRRKASKIRAGGVGEVIEGAESNQQGGKGTDVPEGSTALNSLPVDTGRGPQAERADEAVDRQGALEAAGREEPRGNAGAVRTTPSEPEVGQTRTLRSRAALTRRPEG